MLAAYAKMQYEEMQVQTTPEKQVVMLYDGALRFLHLGLRAAQGGDLSAQGYNLARAQDIFSHLDSVLNMDAGKIAVEMRSIYLYCIRRLFVANAEDRTDYIEEVIDLVDSLRGAWEAAELIVASERSGEPATQVAARCA